MHSPLVPKVGVLLSVSVLMFTFDGNGKLCGILEFVRI